MSDKPSPFANLGIDKALLRSTKPQEAPAPVADDLAAPVEQNVPVEPTAETAARKPRKASKAGSDKPSNQEQQHDSYHASLTASMIASDDASLIAAVRKAVRTPGKEVSFVRLSAEEKRQLADIVYSYKRQGKKTSENEINRIALNCLLEDHKANGEASLLARVIEALLA